MGLPVAELQPVAPIFALVSWLFLLKGFLFFPHKSHESHKLHLQISCRKGLSA